jgi:hypothetical protein
MTPEIEEGIRERLWSEGSGDMAVHVILDAARDDRIYASVQASGTDWVCLYSGRIPGELAKVAPYLVKLSKKHAFTDSVIRNGWGESWGIFFRSNAPLEELRKHFHGLLTVINDEGNRMVFRYYDPRVFRVYLPTCNSDELKTVLGPVAAFMTEDRDASVMVEFRKQADSIEIEHHSLLRAFSRKALEEDLTP